MERDSLLAHGAAYLVHDRLHNCSDYHVMDVCASCGSLLSTMQFKASKHAQQTLHLSAVEADGEHPCHDKRKSAWNLTILDLTHRTQYYIQSCAIHCKLPISRHVALQAISKAR